MVHPSPPHPDKSSIKSRLCKDTHRYFFFLWQQRDWAASKALLRSLNFMLQINWGTTQTAHNRGYAVSGPVAVDFLSSKLHLLFEAGEHLEQLHDDSQRRKADLQGSAAPRSKSKENNKCVSAAFGQLRQRSTHVGFVIEGLMSGCNPTRELYFLKVQNLLEKSQQNTSWGDSG